MSGPPLAARLAAVRERIATAAARAGRAPDEVALVGAAKRQPVAALVEAVACGLDRVGESYVQEAGERRAEAHASLEGRGSTPPSWHFIGRLQRNKARRAAALFDTIETVDRAPLGDALDRAAGELGRRVRIYLQVNVSADPAKGGIAADELAALAEHAARWQHLEPVGLMTLPAAEADPRRAFARLRELRDRLAHPALRELSMGMSGDFEIAVEEGATSVRVGTAIFGPRPA